MRSFQLLKAKIVSSQAKVAVVGLGYVGLPLALALAKRGYFTWGLDKNLSRIEKLKKGEQYIVDVSPKEVLSLIKAKKFFPTIEESVLGESDVIIICVPTPLRKVKVPNISYIIEATKTIGWYLRKAQLVILESTSFPGTTREVVLPLLKKSKLKEEKDFFLCFSPERVNPADKKHPLEKIPKIVGGLTPASSSLAKALYSKIVKKVKVVSSPEVAETAKLLENTFRLVNIALVNEFLIFCHKLGISVWEVISSAKTKPFGFMPFYPGPGLGGHCIPCDPLYLSWKAKKIGFKTKMIDLASYINHFMPKYVVKRLEELFRQRKVPLKNAKILILGVTYKKDVKDLRESPALDIIKLLERKNFKISYYDPLIPYLKINDINLRRISLNKTTLKEYDCLLLVTDHSGLNYKFLRENSRLIFDTRNVYKKDFANVERL